MKNSLVLGLVVCLLGCGRGDDGPTAPRGVVLVFPEKDSECTTGIGNVDSQSQVTFEWEPDKNTDRYTLTVVDLSTGLAQVFSTIDTTAVVSLKMGVPFSWNIRSTNSVSDEEGMSETWFFYNAGPRTNYAPFPARIRFPHPGSGVQANAYDQVVLSWTGADVEDDIVNYAIYFSESGTPITLMATTTVGVTQLAVNVMPGTDYNWKVITTDADGNSSDSGVFQFRVL